MVNYNDINKSPKDKPITKIAIRSKQPFSCEPYIPPPDCPDDTDATFANNTNKNKKITSKSVYR